MTTSLDEGSPRRTTKAALGALAALVLATGCQSHLSGSPSPVVTSASPVPVPAVTTVGAVAGKVPWDHPLALSVVDGTLESVTATDPSGNAVDGEITDAGWTSLTTLVPSSTYTVAATVLDQAGKTSTVDLSTSTSAATKILSGVLSPGDGKVVGIGQTVVLTLNHAVTTHADRLAVVQDLDVTSSPAVDGAWRWMSPTELHYRGPSYWASGTKITAKYDFGGLHLSDGTWGATGGHSTSYSIGSAVISTVDVTKHVMYVRQDGTLLRTVKVSTGRDKYPTKGGVHIVLEKDAVQIMDSSTVGIPRNGPDGYYEKVPNSVRISYGGAFVHSADWSVQDQGVRNVSHGCVNISPSDAAWFFALAKKGDIVNIIHAAVGPKTSDPGMSDWNVAFSSWANS